MLCVKALMKHDYGFRKILQEDEGILMSIIRSFSSTNPRTRVAVMQIMAVVANNPAGGAVRTLQAFQHLATYLDEPIRFLSVIQEIQEGGQDEDYCIASLSCFLSLINNAQDLNMLVYIQTDLQLAGLSDILPLLQNHISFRVRGLVEEYMDKLLSVDVIVSSRDEQRDLYLQASDQIRVLHDTLEDVTKQRDELRQLHKDAKIRVSELQERLKVRGLFQ